MLHIFVKILCHCRCCFVDAVEGAEQGRFVVERFPGIGDKNGGYAKCVVVNECRRGDIPSRIAACFKCVSNAAIRKTGSIGLLLNEQLAAKFFNHSMLSIVFNERIVLFCRAFIERMKPVGVVCASPFDSPFLKTGSHTICHSQIQGLFVVDSVDEGIVCVFG